VTVRGELLRAAADQQTCFDFSITAPRRRDGVLDDHNAGDGPAWSVSPCMIEASSSCLPSLLKTAPLPALNSGESCHHRMAASNRVPGSSLTSAPCAPRAAIAQHRLVLDRGVEESSYLSEGAGSPCWPSRDEKPRVVLVIHGGAGALPKDKMTPRLRDQYETVLKQSLREGHKALKSGTSLDAVEAAIRVMEDSPLFNAGKGPSSTATASTELDASIMHGDHAPGGGRRRRYDRQEPHHAARRVMEKSKHVLLIGRGAEEFALEQSLDIVPHSYFSTPGRREAWKKVKEQEEKERKDRGGYWRPPMSRYFRHGRSGGLRRQGSGGRHLDGRHENKRYGRVGELADHRGRHPTPTTGRARSSCTGHGEMFIRHGVAKGGVLAAALSRRQGKRWRSRRGPVLFEVRAGRPGGAREEAGGVGRGRV